MRKINLFNKEIEYKDYDCSFNQGEYLVRPPIFNLYVQVTDICNAKCDMCNKVNCDIKEEDLNVDKLINILKELTKKNILARISITGGEPLLNVNKLNKVLESIYQVNKNAYVSINTNSSCLSNFQLVKRKDIVKQIDISRHHYEDNINKSVFKIQVATLKEIGSFAKEYPNIKVKLNCVLSKNLIDNDIKVNDYLEKVAQYNFEEIRFISMMDLTDSYKDLYVNPSNFIDKLMEYTNTKILYDKDICQCFGFIYVSSKGETIKATIRDTKKAKCSYLRQLVYNSQNKLLNGFDGEVII